MNKINPKIVIALIFILALFLRFYGLNISPPGFNADEAALGYNAYSILKTGRDEWGESLPLVFKSFSDYKPGFYVYLSLPFVAVLGLTELSVRLPSILIGAFSVLLIYFLSKEIFKKEIAALSSALLLSISPWHLHFSRGAWETNVATFFILLGVLSFVKGLVNFKWFYLSGISFALSMYTYQSPRIVVPVFVLLLAIAYFKQLLTKKIIFPLIFTIILIIPLFLIMVDSKGWSRFQGISIFTDLGIINQTNELRGQDSNPNSLEAKLFHNKLLSYSDSFFNHYLDHFNPDFLFLSGDPLGRNKIPGIGQLYLFEVITLLIGLVGLSKYQTKTSKIIFLWILVAPIAAALTYQTPHALRAHNMVIPLSLISGLGIGIMIDKINQFKKHLAYPLFGLGVFIISLSFAVFLHQYYFHLPLKYALEWESGFQDLVPFVLENQDKYQKIVITDRYDQAYILMLFYSKYDPLKYQTNKKIITDGKYGFSTISGFDKFEFKSVSKEEVLNGKNILYIGTEEEVSVESLLLKSIFYPNGKTVFKIIGT